MSLEFGSSKFASSIEHYNKSMEQLDSTFAVLEGIQSDLFKHNAESIEFMQQSSMLKTKLETASLREFANSKYQETATVKALKELEKRCSKAKTVKDIALIQADFEKLMGTSNASKLSAALEQQSINAGVAIKKKAADMSAPLELSVGNHISSASKQGEEAVKSVVNKTSDAVKNQADDAARIASEAAKRTQAEKIAKKTAEQAQKFYTGLSDVTTGKSAKDSAIVIEASLRNKALAQSKLKAEQAQKYYAAISDVTTGKSAKESAEIIKQTLDKADEAAKLLSETKKNVVKLPAQPLALPPKQEMLALPPHSIVDKSDDAIKATIDTIKLKQNDIVVSHSPQHKTFINKTKNFIKDRIIPFTKTKQFKIAAIATSVTAGLAAVIIHNKNKEEKSQNLNIVK